VQILAETAAFRGRWFLLEPPSPASRASLCPESIKAASTALGDFKMPRWSAALVLPQNWDRFSD
jgi:hypothetical protein